MKRSTNQKLNSTQVERDEWNLATIEGRVVQYDCGKRIAYTSIEEAHIAASTVANASIFNG